MKKKFFGAAVVVAIAVGAMINVNLNKVSNKGDLALANVEALAQSESGQWWNTSPANLTGLQYKGMESYPVRKETGGTTNGSSYSYTVSGSVGATQSGVGGSVGASYTYNSGSTNTTFKTIYCCRDSYNTGTCTPDRDC